MFRLISIEREYGCGGGAIAAQLASRLGWSVWDKRLTEEIARLANVDSSAVKRCDERMNSRLYRLAKTFWRGSHERSSHVAGQVFDTDTMMSMMEQITAKIAKEGNAVVVGRGAPFFLRDHPDTFHVFLYAPRAEKIRRLVEDGSAAEEAEEMVDIVDRERIAYVKHYFNSNWPTRSLYHVMINTAVGNKSVIEIILHTMQLVAGRPKATDYEAPKVPAV
ncbi:MAG: cytidylate kinase-like family protein [Candidatus Sulfotelmatobacter sp.]